MPASDGLLQLQPRSACRPRPLKEHHELHARARDQVCGSARGAGALWHRDEHRRRRRGRDDRRAQTRPRAIGVHEHRAHGRPSGRSKGERARGRHALKRNFDARPRRGAASLLSFRDALGLPEAKGPSCSTAYYGTHLAVPGTARPPHSTKEASRGHPLRTPVRGTPPDSFFVATQFSELTDGG